MTGPARADAEAAADVTARITAALEKVARDCEVPERAIAYRMTIPNIARELQIMRQGEAHRCRAADIQSATRSIRATLRQLESLAGLPWDAGRDCFDTAVGRAALPLPLRLRFIGLAIEAAELAAAIEAAPTPAPAQKGRPRAEAAHAIAARLYREMERLAGRTPGRSVVPEPVRDKNNPRDREGGAFVDLVRTVFDILGVPGSPVEAARAAIEAARGMGEIREPAPIKSHY